jgi:dTDP-glucose pyrophosphorylase
MILGDNIFEDDFSEDIRNFLAAPQVLCQKVAIGTFRKSLRVRR